MAAERETAMTDDGRINRDIAALMPDEYSTFDDAEIEDTIQERFSYIVRKYGDRQAVKDGSNTTTYTELDQASGLIASALARRFGVASEPVALLYAAGAAHCAAQFGVLRAGKFYATLDWELSFDRTLAVLRDLGARVILCSRELRSVAESLAHEAVGVSVLDTSLLLETEREARVENATSSADSYAYVVYTSGSTGKPEGVIVTHRMLLHMAKHQIETAHLCAEDRALQICHLSAAASAAEIYSVLLSGGMLLPYPLKTRGVNRLADFLRSEQATVCTFTPVVFRLLLGCLAPGAKLAAMRLIRLCGDRVVRSDVEGFNEHFTDRCILRTSLGSSEAQLMTQYNMTRGHTVTREIVPVGYPMPGMEVFIVDEQQKRLKAGETGEIAIRSRYISVGYWGNAVLTAERFVRDSSTGLTTYLTRDLGCFDAGGCLSHVGRKDARVKINGKLVTLTDIEEIFLGLSGVGHAAVVSIEASDRERYLVGFYVPSRDSGPTPDRVRKELKARLAAEIVPKRIIAVDSLPVTDRNKVDRLRLASEFESLERSSLARGVSTISRPKREAFLSE